MIQRLPIALLQVKVGKTSSRNQTNHLFFVSSKKNTKKVYNNIMNSIKIQYKNEYYIYESWK